MYLYIFWHLGLPSAAIAYALLRNADIKPPISSGPTRAPIVRRIAIIAFIVCALVWLVTGGEDWLPAVMIDAMHSNTSWHYTAPFLIALSIAAIVLVWHRRRSVLDLWLSVVLCAWLIETSLLSTTDYRFSLVWYAGRIYGLLSGVFVLLVLLSEVTTLHAGLARSVLDLRRHKAALERSEARLEEALTAGAVVAFDWDPRTSVSRRSANAPQILGFQPQEVVTASRFLAQIHPHDRDMFKAHIRELRPDRPSLAITFRFVRTDGRVVWLEETATADFDAAGQLLGLKGLDRDISARRQVEEHQQVLMAELDHRVKNVLSRVVVIVRQARRTSDSTAEFIETVCARVQSLVDAHALLTRGRSSGVGLRELVSHQLAPYRAADNTTIGGPDVALTAQATEAVAMTMHELVTNAAKHGALSSHRGHVAVNWELGGDCKQSGALRIEWRETGGPALTTPARSGFGTSLIRKLVPHELGGAVNLEFDAAGVHCTMHIPEDQVVSTISRSED
jgi:PAS domain S-box-containing protein